MPDYSESVLPIATRRRTHWSIRSTLGSSGLVGLGLLGACDAILGIEDESRGGQHGKPGTGGLHGGEGGDGGAPSPGGEGGSGNASTSGASGRAGASGNGGTAGRDNTAGKSGTAGKGGTAGTSGDGGAAGDDTPDGPTLNEPCSDLGAAVCAPANPQIILFCDIAAPPHPAAGEAIWQTAITCSLQTRCTGDPPECKGRDPSCRDYDGPRCSGGNGLIDCDDDFFAPGAHVCPFGCRAGACLPAMGDQLIVHTEVRGGNTVWPGDIPVCFASEDSSDEMKTWIETELEQSWERYVDVDFTGFGTCSGAEPGVVVEFLENCRERLGSAVEVSYPGDGRETRVGICRTYVDGRGETKRMDQDEALTRFVTRHQFGHVLWLNEDDQPGSHSVMRRSIEHPGTDVNNFSADDIRYVRDFYPNKHSSALVTTSGLCLKVVGSGIQPAPCSDERPQWWIPALDELINFAEADNDCIYLPGSDGTIELRHCLNEAPVPTWRMEHARWSMPGDCVEPRGNPAAAGASLVQSACEPMGAPNQSWFFDVFSQDPDIGFMTRIQLSDTNLCVTIPNGMATFGVVPLLEPCGPYGQFDQTFYLRTPGEIAFGSSGEVCLSWSQRDAELFLWTCGPFHHWNNWILSGAVESSSGLVLRVTPDDPASVVTAVPRGTSPTPDQIFDFYF